MNDIILNDFTLSVSENCILLESDQKSSILRFYARDIQYLGHIVSRSLIPFTKSGSINLNNLLPALNCFPRCTLDSDNILKVVCGAYDEKVPLDFIRVNLSTFSELAGGKTTITASVYKKSILGSDALQPLIDEIERNFIRYTFLCENGIISPDNFKKTAAITAVYIVCLLKTLAWQDQISILDDDIDNELRQKDAVLKEAQTIELFDFIAAHTGGY